MLNAKGKIRKWFKLLIFAVLVENFLPGKFLRSWWAWFIVAVALIFFCLCSKLTIAICTKTAKFNTQYSSSGSSNQSSPEILRRARLTIGRFLNSSCDTEPNYRVIQSIKIRTRTSQSHYNPVTKSVTVTVPVIGKWITGWHNGMMIDIELIVIEARYFFNILCLFIVARKQGLVVVIIKSSLV